MPKHATVCVVRRIGNCLVFLAAHNGTDQSAGVPGYTNRPEEGTPDPVQLLHLQSCVSRLAGGLRHRANISLRTHRRGVEHEA